MLQRTRSSFSRERHRPALQSPRFAFECARRSSNDRAGRRRSAMYTLYSMRRSGNCYKVRLALAQLDIPHELIEIDILKGETRTPEFLAKNPSGHVPLLEVAPGRYHRRIERHPLVHRRRHAARARGPHRARRDAAMDVLRAAQPRTQPRRRLFLADAGQGRARTAAARARGLDGGRLSRARRDGEASRRATASSPPTATPSPTSRSTPTPMWRTSATTTSSRFPGGPRLAQARRRAAAPHRDGLAAGGAGRGAVSACVPGIAATLHRVPRFPSPRGTRS